MPTTLWEDLDMLIVRSRLPPPPSFTLGDIVLFNDDPKPWVVNCVVWPGTRKSVYILKRGVLHSRQTTHATVSELRRHVVPPIFTRKRR